MRKEAILILSFSRFEKREGWRVSLSLSKREGWIVSVSRSLCCRILLHGLYKVGVAYIRTGRGLNEVLLLLVSVGVASLRVDNRRVGVRCVVCSLRLIG